MTNQSWKWDAEAAFKRIEATIASGVARDPDGISNHKLRAYKPPSNVAAWLKAQADKPKPHGRDIESLMRYHEAHKKPVGYWEDAPRGMKFGGGGRNSVSADVQKPNAAPTTTPPADDEFEPVGTMPVVGDTYVFTDGRGDNPVTFVDVSATHYADRVWARQCQDNGELWTSDSTHAEREWYARNGRILKRPTKPRDDVATGARAWKNTVSGVVWARIGDKTFCGPVDSQPWSREKHCDGLDPGAVYVELHGPERDAIVAECRKAMGI